MTGCKNGLMFPRVQEILREALPLRVKERTDVAAHHLASMDATVATDPAEVEATWAEEIERPAAEAKPRRR